MSLDVVVNFIATKLYPALLVAFFFGLTIFIHELGHFLVARRCGMKVERFSIGFGPKIFGWKRRGIDYQVCWLPFGGYVALPQMAPMEAIEGKTDSQPEDLPPAAPASKIKVALAGPAMNILLALLLASLVWLIGLPTPYNPSIIGLIEPGSSEDQLGIRAGDRIVEINGKPVTTWMEVNRIVLLNGDPNVEAVIEQHGTRRTYTLAAERNKLLGVRMLNLDSAGRPVAGRVLPGKPAEKAGIQPDDEILSVNGVQVGTRKELIDIIKDKPGQELTLRLLRNGKIVTLTVVPEWQAEAQAAQIGLELEDKLEYRMVRPGPTPVVQFREILGLMGDTLKALLHSKKTGVGPSSLSGPVGIMGGWWQEIKRGGAMRGVWFAVLLNLNLAIINLLPLPVLDGGHIVFALIERAYRRPINPRLVQNLSVTFAVLLIGFMLYITFFDFQRFLGRPRTSNSSPTSDVTPAQSAPAPQAAPAPAP